MGLLDMFWSVCKCPACGTAMARKRFSTVQCRNPGCVNYSAQWQSTPDPTKKRWSQEPLRGSYDPGADAIELSYVNFFGDKKSFKGNKKTLRVRGKHVSVCLAPTGRRVALDRSRIQNAADVDAALKELGPEPSPKEARLLREYMGEDAEIAQYLELRKKYPGWAP